MLEGVSLEVKPGEMVGLIGPNGAGKTTLLNVVSGHLWPDEGSVLWGDRRIDGLPPFQISRLGIRRTFQLTRNFLRLSVLDNCLVSARAAGLPRARAVERSLSLLEELHLAHLAHEPAAHLSGGQQKLLELAACLVADPKLVLLDEPFAAVHPSIKEILAGCVQRQNRSGCGFLIVSHDIPAFSGLCPRIVAMAAGKIVADGALEEVLHHPAVVDAYLGQGAPEATLG